MKTKRITINATEEEYTLWKAAAKADERTLASWIRRRIIGKDAPAPQEVLNTTQKKASIFDLIHQKNNEDDELQ